MRSPLVWLASVLVAAALIPSWAHAALLSGHVFEDLNGNDSLDEGEPCVPSIVSLRPLPGGLEQLAFASCVNGGVGSYHFDLLPPGRYQVTVVESVPAIFTAPSMLVDIPAEDTLVARVQRDFPLRRISRGGPADAVNVIQGRVFASGRPLPGAPMVLEDETGSMIRGTTTDDFGRYEFAELVPGIYQVIAQNPSIGDFIRSQDAIPGPNAVKVDTETLEIRMVPGTTEYPRNDFTKEFFTCDFCFPPSPPTSVPLLDVGYPVLASGHLGTPVGDQLDPSHDVGGLRRLTDSGLVFAVDVAGTALFRFGAGPPQVVLDSTRQEQGRIGLTRLRRVETGRDGTSAILALRTDDTRAIYRLDRTGALTRLAELRDARDPDELAIGDAGQIAYVARAASGGLLALFQDAGSGPVSLLRQGDPLGRARVARVRGLQANGSGDLVFLVEVVRPDGVAVMRKTGAEREVVASTGQEVEVDRGSGLRGAFTELSRPRIGADGTVVFLGAGNGFANFFVARPGHPLQPLLPGRDWSREPTTFDYEIANDGRVVLRATRGALAVSSLYTVAPTGEIRSVPLGRLQPQGRPLAETGSALLFTAIDPDVPPTPTVRLPLGLYRYRDGDTAPMGVAEAGEMIPGKPGARLLSVVQQPVVSAGEIAFAAWVGGGTSLPVPATSLLRVPLGGRLSDGVLVASEGDDLSGAERVARFRNVYYTGDGTLLVDGLLQGAGPLVGAVAPYESKFALLTAIGQPLDIPDRRLLEALGRLVRLRDQRYLLTARFSLGDVSGEGLFTTGPLDRPQKVVVTGDPVADLPGARFAGLGDQLAYTLNPPSVSPDGNVVFKALLERDGSHRMFGLFQWKEGSDPPRLVALWDPNRDSLAPSTQALPPDGLKQWVAGRSGRVYYTLEYEDLGKRVVSLFEGSRTGASALATTGTTRVAGSGAVMSQLVDVAVASNGELFIHGIVDGGEGVFQVTPDGLIQIARRGEAIPRRGRKYAGLIFGERFTLLSESAQSSLSFTADVRKASGRTDDVQRGRFWLNQAGTLETDLVTGVNPGGAREFGLTVLPPGEMVNGRLAYATQSKGRWTIWQAEASGLSLVAGEGQPLAGGQGLGTIVSLDPGPALGLPAGSGPLFRLSEQGRVAFLASVRTPAGGERWGVYVWIH